MPHRKPFLFIDTVERLELPEGLDQREEITSRDLVGSLVVADFYVRADLDILAGHFPGNPILPGVIQVEMMAQTCAFVSLGLKQNDDFDYSVDTLLLGVESSKFRKPVYPDMALKIHARMDKARGLMAQYFCEVFCEGEKISEAKILARLTVKKKEK